MQILSDNDHVVTSTPDVSSSGLPLEILERIIKDAWTDAYSQDEQANLYWTLRATSKVVAVIGSIIAVQYATLRVRLHFPGPAWGSIVWLLALRHYTICTDNPGFSIPAVKHIALNVGVGSSYSSIPMNTLWITQWKRLRADLPAMFVNCRSMTLLLNDEAVFRLPSLSLAPVSTTLPTLTHLHIRMNLPGFVLVSFFGAYFPALTFLRLSDPLNCQCAALEGDRHNEICIFYGITDACPALRHIRLDTPSSLLTVKLPVTVRCLTLFADPMRFHGKLESNIFEYSLATSVRGGLFHTPIVHGACSPPKIEVLSVSEETCTSYQVDAIHERYGVHIEKVMESQHSVNTL
ncbi:uncharacterized protein BXZ73DRAFT_81808 [Epithele typhae]|uniref:uncharacterized protein n=1 Tax=Epithele typhae TaxID=378194 RepID=UPI00200790FF|nr:uncharacterized protein BXZ73DRAFT_81808 [Epithele typhae]KAH9913894.1 hypothetical protein BXZ73DRAFT_81808 [Epithele typhae]